MDREIRKAAVLIEALPYIQRFRGESVVVKLGGSAMEDPAHLESVLTDVAFMECVQMRVVVVHGGGKAISRAMERRGIAPRFLHGLRVTCEETMQVVREVIEEEVNPKIVGLLREKGAQAEPLRGQTVFRVERKTGTDPETGETLDWGYVGEATSVSTDPVRERTAKGVIPVITPLGTGSDGHVHNMNADTAAAAIAKALRARKLVYLSDVPGLLEDPKDPASVLTTLPVDKVEDLVERGVIRGGMLPKVGSGIEALKAGVRKVHMIDGRMQHSLLLEIFTDRGVGTEIVGSPQARRGPGAEGRVRERE